MNLNSIFFQKIHNRPRCIHWLVIVLIFSLAFSSCQEDWLEKKRDISLAVPSSLSDLQALLHNSNVFQYEPKGFTLALADNYFVTDEVLQSLDEVSRNTYTWNYDNLYSDWTYIPDWDDNYHQVFVANVILEELEDVVVGPENLVLYNSIKGGALFFRARAFFNLAQLYCAPYQVDSEAPGIPLRLASDVEAPVARSSVTDTYAQIIADLQLAASLLPESPEFKLDPSKPAAFGLLARCYLSMRSYEQALSYADSSLQVNDVLLDYNIIDGEARYPFEQFNDEVILHSIAFPTYPLVSVSRGNIDSVLLASYEANDLRGDLFVREYSDGRHTFRGAYTGSSSRFGGIAVDEMFLVRAECNARAGNVQAALEDLNTLLAKRYISGTLVPLDITDPDEALRLILEERRKELLFRGLRWTDLRRLNMEPEFAIDLIRDAEGETYHLPAGDPRYVLPIPDYVITQSEIQQNQYP